MGYTTNFQGEWEVTPPLTEPHRAYLEQFTSIRHMKRDEDKAALLPDPLRLAVGLPIGYEGAYYVGTADRISSQNPDPSVLDSNEPPGVPQVPPANPANKMGDWHARYMKGLELKAHALALGLAVPGLWCGWTPRSDGSVIEWDEGEKFYDYIDWIEYLIAHFLSCWGYKLNGDVYWDGEESDDRGLISITDNVVTVKHAQVTYV